MINITKIVNDYCIKNKITIRLSFDMPSGYETANGMYDDEAKTIYININNELPDYELAFYLYHELRHALQYNQSNKFSKELIMSLNYVIMYDGTCFKKVNGIYCECKIDGDHDYLLDLYKGQLYEVDANKYAYERVREMYGDAPELKVLYNSFQPTRNIVFEKYAQVYQLIDEKLQLK